MTPNEIKISTDYIQKLILNCNSFKSWDSNLNQYGEPQESGSFEFELSDNSNRMWGGRFIEHNGNLELVEIYPKIFYSDFEIDVNSPEFTPEQLQAQPIDKDIDLL